MDVYSAVKNPRVSVLMPAYNSETLIGESILSVLGQTFSDFELLICDDGSSDATLEVIHGFDDPRIRVLRNEKNMGIAATRNRLVREAIGEFCAWLDNDDIALPHRLQTQVDFFDAHPEVDICSGPVEIMDERPNPQINGDIWHDKVSSHNSIKMLALFECAVSQTTIMFRRKKYVDEGIEHIAEAGLADDMGVYREAIHKLRFENLDRVLCKYRIRIGRDDPQRRQAQLSQALDCLEYQYDKLGIELSEQEKEILLRLHVSKGPRRRQFKVYRAFAYLVMKANDQVKLFDNELLAGHFIYLYRVGLQDLPLLKRLHGLPAYKRFERKMNKHIKA